MRSRFLLLLLIVLTTGCMEAEKATKLDPADSESSSETSKPMTAEPEPTAAEAAEALRKTRMAEATTKYASLAKEINARIRAYSMAGRKVKTPEQREQWASSNPMKTFTGEFVDFAKEYEGTEEALRALKMVASRGLGTPQTDASEILMGIVNADPDSDNANDILSLLATRSSGKPKSMALSKLFAMSEAETDADSAYEMLSMIAFTSGEDDSKTKAIEKLMGMAKENPDSERSINSLFKFATQGEGETKASAMETLIEDHVDHDNMINVMTAMSRALPTPEAYEWTKQISEKATAAKIKGNAIIGQIEMLEQVESVQSYMESATEEELSQIDERVVEFVKTERGPSEAKDLEKMLEAFVKDNAGMFDKAENKLFEIQHLSIGCEAPDITGIDLDGNEFKLSDYRGKVVFLDFWGDW